MVDLKPEAIELLHYCILKVLPLKAILHCDESEKVRVWIFRLQKVWLVSVCQFDLRDKLNLLDGKIEKTQTVLFQMDDMQLKLKVRVTC